MNGFEHLPEYDSAARAYRLERIRIERGPRRSAGRLHLLRRLVAVVASHRTAAPATAPATAAR